MTTGQRPQQKGHGNLALFQSVIRVARCPSRDNLGKVGCFGCFKESNSVQRRKRRAAPWLGIERNPNSTRSTSSHQPSFSTASWPSIAPLRLIQIAEECSIESSVDTMALNTLLSRLSLRTSGPSVGPSATCRWNSTVSQDSSAFIRRAVYDKQRGM